LEGTAAQVEKAGAGKMEETEERGALEAKVAMAMGFTVVRTAGMEVTAGPAEMVGMAVKEAREVLVVTAPT
jgi:hypothetical protein